jgi:hypothetical protein
MSRHKHWSGFFAYETRVGPCVYENCLLLVELTRFSRGQHIDVIFENGNELYYAYNPNNNVVYASSLLLLPERTQSSSVK